MQPLTMDNIATQGWAPADPSLSSPWNANWPLERLDDPPGSNLPRYTNLSDMMPASWRPGVRFGDESEIGTGGDRDGAGWSASVPSREQYQRYNMTAGSARLALNTRWKSPTNSMQENLPGRRPPPIPIGTGDVEFNDSDARQSMIYNSTGFWPGKASC